MQKNDNIFITKDGLEKLKAELKTLLEVKRPSVAKRIQIARENGDISENAEYDAARQEQATVEGRIEELEDIIHNAKVSANVTKKDEVGLGCVVTVHVDGGQEKFQIVGTPESDPLANRISHESPLGVALVGKKVGDKIDVKAPVGTLTYSILKIDY